MPPRTSARNRTRSAAEPTEEPAANKPVVADGKTGQKRKTEQQEEQTAEEDACGSCAEDKEEKPVKKRKTTGKTVKEEDMTPLALRTAVSTLGKKMYIGAHVSGAGGWRIAPQTTSISF